MLGPSGSGKLVMIQSIILNLISQGSKALAIDMGKPYRKLAEAKSLKTIYMDAGNIRLNLFTFISCNKFLRVHEKGQTAVGNPINLIRVIFEKCSHPM